MRATSLTKKKKTCKILRSTSPLFPVERNIRNGFINAGLMAYSRHFHLVLRPDDIWLAIGTTFANFVDAHAEQMRKLFVSHSGKKDLTIYANDVSVETGNWDAILQQMAGLIEKNTNPIIRQWIEPNFSTTTNNDRLIGNILLMGAMKKYFNFRCSTMCGLPAITLEGTLEDWKNIRLRAEKIKEIAANSPSNISSHLSKWYNILTPVLEQFIETYQGNVDKNFWQSISSWIPGGSGQPSYITGWLNVFIPFSSTGYFLLDKTEFLVNSFDFKSMQKESTKKSLPYGRIDSEDIPIGVVEVPVEIEDRGKKFKTIFQAGSFISSYDKQTNRMAPSFDWVIIEASEE